MKELSTEEKDTDGLRLLDFQRTRMRIKKAPTTDISTEEKDTEGYRVQTTMTSEILTEERDADYSDNRDLNGGEGYSGSNNIDFNGG